MNTVRVRERDVINIWVMTNGSDNAPKSHVRGPGAWHPRTRTETLVQLQKSVTESFSRNPSPLRVVLTEANNLLKNSTID